MLLSNRDVHTMRRMLQDIVEMGSQVNDPSTVTFHSFTRTDDGTQVARYLDNAAYNLYASDQGYTSSEKTLTIPCKIIPKTHTLRLTDFGYEEDSDLEIEISPRDLVAHGIKISDIAHTFEYITIDTHDDVGLQGRAKTNTEQLWDVSSIRPLTVAGSKEIFGVRVGLKLTESDTSELAYAAIGT